MKNCRIYIQEHEKKSFLYTINLTENELISITGMPHKLLDSGTPGTPSHKRLENAKIDIYRLGEEISIIYDNSKKDNVILTTPYSKICDELYNAHDAMSNGIIPEIYLFAKKKKLYNL